MLVLRVFFFWTKTMTEDRYQEYIRFYERIDNKKAYLKKGSDRAYHQNTDHTADMVLKGRISFI